MLRPLEVIEGHWKSLESIRDHKRSLRHWRLLEAIETIRGYFGSLEVM